MELGDLTLIDTEELEVIKDSVQYYKKQYKESIREIARLTDRLQQYEDSRKNKKQKV